MKCKNSITENCHTLALSGRFTFTDSEYFASLLGSIGAQPCNKVVLDMVGLEFMDSAALGMILLARDTAAEHGCEIFIRCNDGMVRKMLKLAKIEDIIPFTD